MYPDLTGRFSRLAGRADLLSRPYAARIGITLLAAAGLALMLAAAYQMIAYIRVPVDLLSFSESSFVNDILKFRLGTPIYTPPADNSAYPYMPGAPILTYLIAALLGQPDSIPVYRAVQFAYVILAAIMALRVSDLLARKLLTEEEYRHRPLWLIAWLPFLFLVAIDDRFNAFNYSLHNDGLALLVTVTCFWLLLHHSNGPRGWHLLAMMLLPTLGFVVKQSLLIWIGIFPAYLLVSGKASLRQSLLVLLGAGFLAGGVIAFCYTLWGENYVWWIFTALGDKEIAPARSLMNLLRAGAYAAFGLFAGYVLVLRRPARDVVTLWLIWSALFGMQAYTSGIGWNVNHLGPGVVLATSWFLVAIARLWPKADISTRAGAEHGMAWWQHIAQQLGAAAIVLFVFAGALGAIRPPVNPIPADLERYIADIEAEFEDLPAEQVLLDSGTWVYLEEGVVMKDRAWAVSLHNGENQPINHILLRETIDRIQDKTYARILAHELDTPENWYDYHDRGSGVKAAIFDNYQVVRRIPAVKGINAWSSISLVSEILVLEPNQN